MIGGTLLVKSAGFKKIPEDIQIKHETNAKIYSKTIGKPIKNKSKQLSGKLTTNIIKKIANLEMVGPILDPIAWNFNPVDSLFADLFFRNLRGHPQE